MPVPLMSVAGAFVKAILQAPAEAPTPPDDDTTPQPIATTPPTTRPTMRPSTRPSGRTRVPVPLGFAGPEIDLDADGTSDLIPIPDRWRIGTPSGYL